MLFVGFCLLRVVCGVLSLRWFVCGVCFCFLVRRCYVLFMCFDSCRLLVVLRLLFVVVLDLFVVVVECCLLRVALVFVGDCCLLGVVVRCSLCVVGCWLLCVVCCSV